MLDTYSQSRLPWCNPRVRRLLICTKIPPLTIAFPRTCKKHIPAKIRRQMLFPKRPFPLIIIPVSAEMYKALTRWNKTEKVHLQVSGFLAKVFFLFWCLPCLAIEPLLERKTPVSLTLSNRVLIRSPFLRSFAEQCDTRPIVWVSIALSAETIGKSVKLLLRRTIPGVCC